MTKMLARISIYGFGISMDLIAAKRQFPDNPDIYDISYYRAFTRVIEAMKDVAKEMAR